MKAETMLRLFSTPRMHMNSGADEPWNFVHGLYQMVNEFFLKEHFTIAEIGCYAGVSTEVFALHCHKVYAIDIWQDYASNVECEFDTRCKIYPNIEKMKMPSLAAAAKFKAHSLDAVYLDGGHRHENIVQDIHAWMDKIRPGGFLCGHDYSDNHPGVKGAIDKILNGPDKVYCDTSWVKRI